jgi:membrane protease YdiL (CAAX protease family)
MRRLRPPIGPILLLAAIVVLIRIAALPRDPFILLRPDFVAAALMLYTPFLYYRGGRAPSWIRPGSVRKSLLAAGALLASGTALFLLYLTLPFPEAFRPPADPIGRPGEFLARMALLVALPEEVFFRGYLYDALEERGWEPVTASSLLFALAHVAILPSPYRALTFFPGLAFGWARKATGAVYVPILLHFAFNLLPLLAGRLP